MKVPEWLRKQVITLDNIDGDLDEETVKIELSSFGSMYVLRFSYREYLYSTFDLFRRT